MDFSLIVPVFVGENFIEEDLADKISIINDLKEKNCELIYVLDGKYNKTENILKDSLKKQSFQNVKIISYEKNEGKGFAVKKGFEIAKGEYVGFLDFGNEIDGSIIKSLLAEIKRTNSDIAIANKFLPESDFKAGFLRKFLSKAFVRFSNLILGQNFSDTQTGAKVFGPNGVNLFRELKTKGFAFDLEILSKAKKIGLKILEVPVRIKKGMITSVSLQKVLQMVFDVFRIKKILSEI